MHTDERDKTRISAFRSVLAALKPSPASRLDGEDWGAETPLEAENGNAFIFSLANQRYGYERYYSIH